MTGFHPDDVRAAFAENRTRLLSIIEAVRPAIPANIETKKEPHNAQDHTRR